MFCPRCGDPLTGDLYGPCAVCRINLNTNAEKHNQHRTMVRIVVALWAWVTSCRKLTKKGARCAGCQRVGWF